jgi:hypothetical protein
MKIKVLNTFLDGRDRFEKDDVRTVSDEEGARFVGNGWAEDVSGAIPTGETAAGGTDLTIASGMHAKEVNHG